MSGLRQMVSSIVMLPWRSFVHGVGLMYHAMRDMQGLSEVAVSRWMAQNDRGAGLPAVAGSDAIEAITDTGAPARGGATKTIGMEEADMPDQDLSGKDFKVVQYSIVDIGPYRDSDEGRLVFGPATEVISDDLSGEDFATWAVARLPKETMAGHKAKYLRVAYAVQGRFAQTDTDYERDQTKYAREEVQVLREIAEKMPSS